MYTPDARQQWVGWHSRIVGEGVDRDVLGGGTWTFFLGGDGRIKERFGA